MAEAPRKDNSTRDFSNSGLDRTYTVFGEVFRGTEIVDKIAAAPCDDRDNPLEPITVTMKE